MKYISILLLVYIFFSFSLIQKKEKKIYWSEKNQLIWDDFKGTTPSVSEFSAITLTGIERNSQFADNVLDICIKSYVIPTLSWVKSDAKTPILLKHENIHFDITEIYARKFRKEVLNTKFIKSNLKNKLLILKNTIDDEKDKYQAQYDKETSNSRNEVKQLEWNEKISKELNELKDFSEPQLRIEIK